jgi:hypothetical protein
MLSSSTDMWMECVFSDPSSCLSSCVDSIHLSRRTICSMLSCTANTFAVAFQSLISRSSRNTFHLALSCAVVPVWFAVVPIILQECNLTCLPAATVNYATNSLLSSSLLTTACHIGSLVTCV